MSEITHGRRLRRPFRIILEALSGAVIGIVLALVWCYVLEALTGINPIWILEAVL